MTKHFAIIVGDTRNLLIGPFQSQEERERSIGFNVFDFRVAKVLRLDLCGEKLMLKERGQTPPVTRHVPQLTLFDPESR
jgi:hypothetical protein